MKYGLSKRSMEITLHPLRTTGRNAVL